MKITYTLVGDYYRPNLVAPESPKVSRWGMLRFNYLRKHREALYTIPISSNPHEKAVPDRQPIPRGHFHHHAGGEGQPAGKSQL